MRFGPSPAVTVLTAALVLACDGTPAAPPLGGVLAFSVTELSLGSERSQSVTLRNTGDRAVGPVELSFGAVREPGGGSVPGARVRSEPEGVSTLNPGDEVELALRVELGSTLQPGRYSTLLTARAGADVPVALLALAFEVGASGSPAGSVRLGAVPEKVRQGDVVGIGATARDDAGEPLEGAVLSWSVDPPEAGFVGSGGSFVGYRPGPARLVVRAGEAADSAFLDIEARALSGSFQVVGTGVERSRYTSDLWVRAGHAYLGTWSLRQGLPGNTLFTWSVTAPSTPRLTDSLRVDARTVNDVKVHPERPLALITHELSEDGLNGVTLLDLKDPGHPHPLSRFTTGLAPGVHNAWLEGDYAYLVVDGLGNGLRVLDISNPSEPRIVASWYAGGSFLHDVYVRDGLAFLSHWDAGLVILDVGNGMAGGSPVNPVEVSRLSDLGGQTHNAWYWPDGGYVFVGEEDFGSPGYLHVVDVHDLRSPREVASFQIAGETPHNAWLDEERGVLYVAWYGEGAVALDVTGELLGDLSRQGREIVGLRYNGGPGSCAGGSTTCSWGPQLVDGLLYLSDLNSGLVVLRPVF